MDFSLPTDPARRDEIYTALREGLDAISPDRRGKEWLKASLFINCLFRFAGNDTFRQLQEFKEHSDDQTFDQFAKKLFAVLHPQTLGPHGYNRSLGSQNRSSNWEIVAKTGSIFEELGYDWFINSGTLLGAIRDGNFIPHDDDVDLAVILPGDNIEAVARSWCALREEVQDRGMLVPWGDKNRYQIHFKVKAKFGLGIFPCWIIDERVFIWPHTYGEIGEKDLLPLSQFSIGAVTVKVPAMPEKVLELNYGPDWRVPNPAWRFNWRSAWKKFHEFRATYRAATKRGAVT